MAYPNLRAEMARSGVSVANIATALGVNKGSVYNWFNGKGDFNVGQAKTVVRMFPGMTFDYLFKEA